VDEVRPKQDPSAEPAAARLLNKWAAIIAAAGALVAAVYGGVKIFIHDGVGGGTTVAQTASVEVLPPQIRSSSASFDVNTTVAGQKGRDLRLAWTLWDAERGRPVQEKGFADQTVTKFEPSSDDVQRSFQAEVPVPSTTDLVFLRVELFDPSGSRLAFDDSEQLRIGGFQP